MEDIDIDALVGELQERVAVRRAAGDYPPGLEEQLEAEFKVIMNAVHRGEINTNELIHRVHTVEAAAAAIGDRPKYSSRIPGGRVLHATTGRFVERHTNLLGEHVRKLANDMTLALHEVTHLLDMQREADERQLSEMIGSVLDRLAIVDHLADAVLELERRVRDLEMK